MRSLAFWFIAIAGLAATPLAAQSTPTPYTQSTRYDANGHLVGTIAPDPDGAGPLGYAATRTTYDSYGRATALETGELSAWQAASVAPVAWSGFSVQTTERYYYGDYGQLLKTTLEANGIVQKVTQYSYDADRRKVCIAVRMNPSVFGSLPVDACVQGTPSSYGPDRIERLTYDQYDHVLKIERGVGTPLVQDYVTYTKEANGLPTSVKDANGNLATMEYDYYWRLTKWSFPSKTSPGSVSTTDYEQYGYDANGNRTSLRKRDGSTITYSYDALNRVTGKVVPERAGLAVTHTRDVYYGYDLRGLQLYARFDSAAGQGVTNSYDGFGRLTGTTLTMDGSWVVGHTYDADGNLTSTTYPDGNTVTYKYDGLDRPVTILRSGTAAIASYAYDGQGHRTGFNGGFVTSYGYDSIGRLNALNNNLSAPGASNQWTFAYNPASQIMQTVRSNDLFAWSGSYNVERTYSTNGLNQYTTAGAASFGYDPNGNLTSDGSSSFIYDIENRLVTAAGGGKNAALRYDPLGRLYEVSSGTSTTRFVYDGDALIGEYDAAGNLLRRYVHGADLQADDPIAWYEGSGFTGASERVLRSDWQGSIVAVSNSTGATLLAANSYDEYGIPGAANAGRFQYTGQAWLPELGMYYYKARIYSPTLGRFMQTDPIGYKDQINLYAYVANDPVDHVDPTGLETGTFANGCMGDSCMNIDPGGKVHRAALWGMVGVASLFVGPEVLGIRFGAAVTVRVGNALFKAGEAASTRLAENAITKAANATLSGLAKGEGRVIAGNGSKDALRAGESLAKKYGGEASDYQKVSSSTIAESSNGAKVEVHAYRNVETGRIYEPKIKVQGGSQ